MNREFDFIVIGGGSAGYAAARTAHDGGASVAVVEGGEEVGGLCILRGCMPSKTLISSSSLWHEINRAEEFGLEVKPVRPHLDKIVERKKRLIGEFADYRKEQLEDGRFTFLRGWAAFTDSHTLKVSLMDGGEETIKGRTFLIATGSVISRIPAPGLEEANPITSDEALNLTTLPQRLAVLGGGVIAVELGQYFANLGAKTTQIQRSPHILKEFDQDVSESVEAALRKDGIDLFTGTKLKSVTLKDGAKVIEFEHEGTTKTVEVDEILLATGREPATQNLGLDVAGVELDGKRVAVSDAMQTSAPHIFAAGDVTGLYEIVHIAIQQGEAAAANALKFMAKEDASDFQRMDYRLKALVVFSHPEMASVGLSEKEAKAEGIDYVAASYPFNDHGKSIVMGETHGFVKLLAERSSGEIIGGQIVGPHASDLIHEIIAVMYFHGTAKQLALMPHYHPTLAEIITYPAEEIAEELGQL